jgi:membrane protein required for colicin V production
MHGQAVDWHPFQTCPPARGAAQAIGRTNPALEADGAYRMDIHWFDLATIVVLILSGIWSLYRGFLREMLSLLGFVVMVALVVYAYPYVFGALEEVVSESWVRQVVGMALVFIVAVTVFVAFVKLGVLLTHALGLSILDRLLGFCFGLLKVVVFVSLLFLVGNRFLPGLTAALTHASVLGPAFGYTAGLLERTIMEQGLSILEEAPIVPDQLPVLPDPALPDPFTADESVPGNGAPAPEPQ